MSTYRLFITAGIFTADAVNFGTEKRSHSGSWRIPIGVDFICLLILDLRILLFPDSPRYAHRKDHVKLGQQWPDSTASQKPSAN